MVDEETAKFFRIEKKMIKNTFKIFQEEMQFNYLKTAPWSPTARTSRNRVDRRSHPVNETINKQRAGPSLAVKRVYR